MVIEGRAAANDECSNVAKEKRKRLNKLPIQIAPCKLSIYQKQVQNVVHDPDLRPPPGAERAEKKASRQRMPMHGETDLRKPAKRPFVIGMWQ